MRLSTILLPALGALLAEACTSELDCDPTYGGTTTNSTTKRSLRRQVTPTVLQSYKTWTSNNCWSDLVGNLRALNDIATGVNNNAMTVESCLDACAAEGLNLAGVEYSRECFCGNTIIGDNRPIDNSKCNMACTGNPNELCGGPGALNLYVNNNYQFTEGPASVVQSYNGWEVTQCWQDSLSSRILPFCNTDIPHDTLTVAACIDKCSSLGYTSAGVEYGQECYCGNVNYPIGQSLPMSDCDMACLGDATQICGGHLTLVAYTKPTQITYKGVIQVFSGATSLGYMQIDPNYWTPMLTPDITAAVPLSFQGPSGATSFSNIGFSISGTFPFLGLVAGRDSTSSNIATGSFNYLYIDQMEPTAPGATPQSVPSFFATSSGLNKQGESNDWSVDLISGAVTAQWINTDSSLPATILFIQSNHIYAGGDPNAFHGRFPAPVTTVTFKWIPQ